MLTPKARRGGGRKKSISTRRPGSRPGKAGLACRWPWSNVLCVLGEPTTCASRMLENFRPPYDATVIARPKSADAVLIGKTNMDEFAMGGSNRELGLSVSHAQPWISARIPGGSSGARRPASPPAWASPSIGTDTGGVRSASLRLALWRFRVEADPWPREPLRADRLRQQSRPDRAAVAAASRIWRLLHGSHRRSMTRSDSTSVNLPVPEYTKTDSANRSPACRLASCASICRRT